MAWSKQTQDSLNGWLARTTYNSGHRNDEAFFSAFVASVWNDEHSQWDEGQARDIIYEKAVELHPEFNKANAEEAVKYYVPKGTVILNFLLDLREKGQLSLLSS